MYTFLVRSAFVAVALGAAIGLSGTAWAQWLKHPTAGVPKTADGKPNLSAPTPRTPDGRPDFSGIWLTNNDYGHLEIGVTVDDPKAYTRP